jgi:hypothetical protein
VEIRELRRRPFGFAREDFVYEVYTVPLSSDNVKCSATAKSDRDNIDAVGRSDNCIWSRHLSPLSILHRDLSDIFDCRHITRTVGFSSINMVDRR